MGMMGCGNLAPVIIGNTQITTTQQALPLISFETKLLEIMKGIAIDENVISPIQKATLLIVIMPKLFFL